MIYKVRFFKPKEFRCRHCGQLHINPGLVMLLDLFRASLGYPVTVSSGFRCREHNRMVAGAAKDSRHMYGLAADLICPPQITFAHFIKAAEKIFDREGYECYGDIQKNYIHVAIPRGNDTEPWRGDDIIVS